MTRASSPSLRFPNLGRCRHERHHRFRHGYLNRYRQGVYARITRFENRCGLRRSRLTTVFRPAAAVGPAAWLWLAATEASVQVRASGWQSAVREAQAAWAFARWPWP